LETAASISSLDAPPGGTAYDRFLTDPGMPRSRQPPPTRVRRFAVDDDELADFDEFDDFDDDERIEDGDDFDEDEDEFEDAFADTDGGWRTPTSTAQGPGATRRRGRQPDSGTRAAPARRTAADRRS